MSRNIDFQNIQNALSSLTYYKDDNAIVINEDSVNALKLIPDHSVSLILTDPPYHSTKKDNIVNDKSFSTDEDFINWMEIFSVEWKESLDLMVPYLCSALLLWNLNYT